MAGTNFRARGLPEEWVEIEHDGIDGTATVAPQSLPHWEARGWRKVGAATAASERQAPAVKTTKES